MGFKDFYTMNTALLAKQAWRLINEPSSYWAATLKVIYFPNSDFLKVKLIPGAYWVWQSILHGRNLIVSSGQWNVGPGNDIDISAHKWVASGKLISLSEGSSIRTVNQLMNTNKSWDIDILRRNVPPQDAIEVIKTIIIRSMPHDSIYWPYTNNGGYSTKSGYRRLFDMEGKQARNTNTSHVIPIESWHTIWNAKVPQKIKQFMWKVYHNALPVKSNLYRRKISNSPICTICQDEEETVEHTLLLCPWTRPVWCSLQLCHPSSRIGSATVDQWITQTLSDTHDAKELAAALFVTLWNIWKMRNEVIYQEKNTLPDGSYY